MPSVQLTDTVSIVYTATLENGTIVDQAHAQKPLTLAIGSGRVCKAVEACLLGMQPGETRIIRVQPEDAYGDHLPELVQKIDRSVFAGRIDPQPGLILSQTVEKEGRKFEVPTTVVGVDEESVTVDYNHPLAGKVIVYTVTLQGIHH